MKSVLVLCTLLVLALFANFEARGQEDQYLQIYRLIQDGDNLRDSAQALARYLEAQSALQSFQKLYPDWNNKVVTYRLNYLTSRIADVSSRTPVPVPAQKAETAPKEEATANEGEIQLNAFQSQIRQLQADKMLLEAKLKESLSAQPAAIDPRQLERAEQEIKTLQKENELLKVNLEQHALKTASTDDLKTLAETKKDLAEANRKLAEQTEKAGTLAAQKETLQTKLDNLIPASWNEKNIERTKKDLEEANRRLAAQTELASRLSTEKSALAERVKSLSADAETAAALRAENEILKKQAAQLKAAPEKPADTDRRWFEAQAQIAALQSDKEMLRLEKIALENRVKKLSAPEKTDSATAAANAGRLRQVEQERDDLKQKLEAAEKKLAGHSRKGSTPAVDDLTAQLEVLRTRLAVLDAQKIPYTAEELALFKRPEGRIADAKSAKAPASALPAGAMTLIAEAQRDFSARHYEQAEEKYRKVLSQDENNVYTLANLAAIQLEINHLDDAEKNISKALALNPNDSYSLSILGYLRFQQKKYDDALDVLGRAARLEPRDARIQNYLGLTLSQKGMREAAETALRKAIELEPNYADAHYNLAVTYLTQKPPALALARWHYNKARAGGLASNADLERMLEDGKTASADSH